MRANGHCHAERPDCRAVNPRDAVFDARIIDEIPRAEIVRPVKHEIAIRDETLDVALIHVGDFRFHRVGNIVAITPFDGSFFGLSVGLKRYF